MKRLAASKEAAKNNPVAAGGIPSMANSFGMMKPAMAPMMPMLPVRSDKYKTVPCKYFHSPLGCQKKDECTFIHDETCAGFPTRNMHRYVKGMEVPPPNYYFMGKPGMQLARPNFNPNSAYPPMDPAPGGAPSVNINLNSLNHNGGVPLTNMNRPQHLNGSGPGGPMPMINSMTSYNTGAYAYQNYPYGPNLSSGGNLPPSPFLPPPMSSLPPPPANNQQGTSQQQPNSTNRPK